MIYDEGYVEKPIADKYRNALRFIRKSLLDLVSLCDSVHSDAVEICTFNLCFLHKSTGKRTKFRCSDFRS